MSAEHAPKRPIWDCAACGQSYPCPRARQLLAREFLHARSTLTIYLGAQFAEALHDLAGVAGPVPEDLHARFFAWIPVALAEAEAEAEGETP